MTLASDSGREAVKSALSVSASESLCQERALDWNRLAFKYLLPTMILWTKRESTRMPKAGIHSWDAASTVYIASRVLKKHSHELEEYAIVNFVSSIDLTNTRKDCLRSRCSVCRTR